MEKFEKYKFFIVTIFYIKIFFLKHCANNALFITVFFKIFFRFLKLDIFKNVQKSKPKNKTEKNKTEKHNRKKTNEKQNRHVVSLVILLKSLFILLVIPLLTGIRDFSDILHWRYFSLN